MSSFKKMLGNRSFQFAFLLSVFLHGLAFSGLGAISAFSRQVKPNIEINYYEHKSFPGPKIEKLSPPAAPAAAERREEEKILLAKKSISTPAADSPKDSKAAGREYYEIVREKIRNSVKYPSPAVEGDVFLTFVLLTDGCLENKPQILAKESNGESALRRAALAGIIDASPFPTFPAEISQSRLTFNIVISFRLNE